MKLCVLFLALASSAVAQTLWFEPNQRQAHPSVQFLARSPNRYVYLDGVGWPSATCEWTCSAPAEMRKPISNNRSVELPATSLGATTKTGTPASELSPSPVPEHLQEYRSGLLGSGRDVVFMVQAGADPSQIKLAYNKPVQIQTNGHLTVASLRQRRPKVYQNDGEIACNYLVRAGQVELAVSSYDQSMK